MEEEGRIHCSTGAEMSATRPGQNVSSCSDAHGQTHGGGDVANTSSGGGKPQITLQV